MRCGEANSQTTAGMTAAAPREMVELFNSPIIVELKAKVDVNATNQDGRTALMLAAISGR